MRVLQASGDTDLLLEPIRAQRRRDLRMQHLEGDWAIVPEIVGQKHGRETAASKLTLDAVGVGQRRGKRRVFVQSEPLFGSKPQRLSAALADESTEASSIPWRSRSGIPPK